MFRGVYDLLSETCIQDIRNTTRVTLTDYSFAQGIFVLYHVDAVSVCFFAVEINKNDFEKLRNIMGQKFYCIEEKIMFGCGWVRVFNFRK